MLKYLFLVALVVYSANAHVIELLERIIEPILGVEDPNMQKRQDTEHGIQLLDQLLQNENLLDIRTGRSRSQYFLNNFYQHKIEEI